jgi:hypothetical protein
MDRPTPEHHEYLQNAYTECLAKLEAAEQRAEQAEADKKHLYELIAEQGKKIQEYESNPCIPANIALLAELEKYKRALDQACKYVAMDTPQADICPLDGVEDFTCSKGYPKEHESCAADMWAVIECWEKHFLAQAERGQE